MPNRHARRRPDREEPAPVERVPHVAVEARRRKGLGLVLHPAEVEEHLTQTEHVEVVDQHRRNEDQAEPTDEQGVHQQLDAGATSRPQNRWHGLPEGEQHPHGDAGEEDVGAALDRLRNDPGPPGLEGRAGHDTVLDGEEPEHGQVQGDGDPQGGGLAGIDGLGEEAVAEEGR